jgi:hypothetical protein
MGSFSRMRTTAKDGTHRSFVAIGLSSKVMDDIDEKVGVLSNGLDGDEEEWRWPATEESKAATIMGRAGAMASMRVEETKWEKDSSTGPRARITMVVHMGRQRLAVRL